MFQKKSGVPSDKVNPDTFPEVKWVSSAEGNRPQGDMEDRAAKYLRDQNLILANRDFRVFRDMTDRWVKEYKGVRGVETTVKGVVESWFEQALVETVLGVQALENTKQWSPENINSALSEEALTATVMQRYHVNTNVKRELGAKLGKAQVAA